ncbi:MAG: hypothetical protein K9M54_01900 [Kiritimatiellales bacterium]|nr:hypothetical protein [Kiritimatiellales bacterium]
MNFRLRNVMGARGLRMQAALWMCLGLSVISTFAGAPPLTEEFLNATLPSVPFSFTSSAQGRIGLVADSSLLQTVDVQGGTTFSSATSANLTRGNYYRCDQSVNLQKQAVYLGRSVSSTILFSVYESSTEGGTYTLKGSSTVTAAVGTNLVTSGEMNIPLIAGKFYIISAAWSNAVWYRWGGSHPVATGFGTSLSGYYLNGYPSGTTAAGASTGTVYPQQLIFSTNQVVRMDSVAAGAVSTNSMDLALDLTGYTDVTLEFRYRDNSDEDDLVDGIFLSNNSGTSYTRVDSLSTSSGAWQTRVLDIDALASANGLALNNSMVIRFQQSDNQQWSGNDGREFDSIKLYSKPDLVATSLKSGGSTTVSKLWKGFSASKTIPLEFAVQSRGGNTSLSAPSVRFSKYLYDTGGTLRLSAYDTVPWNIGAMEIKTDTLTPVLTIPAATHLPDLNYTVRAFADALGAIPEAFENNNDKTIAVTVNHYSGNLWFGDVVTDITITDWGTRVASSPIEHWITGTGLLEGRSFSFTNLKVDKNLTTLDYSLDTTETTVINVLFPNRQVINDVDYWHTDGINLSRIGAYGDILVLLPAGLGISTNSATVLDPTVKFVNKKLNQSLYPASSVSFAANMFMAEETKPLVFNVGSISWNPAAGTFSFGGGSVAYTRSSQLSMLAGKAGLLVDPAMAVKKSNDAYYRGVDLLQTNPEVETGPNGEAQFSVKVSLASVAMTTHFPYGVEQKWFDPSEISIKQDLIDSSISQLKTPNDLSVLYTRDCPGPECAGVAGSATVVGQVASDTALSMDGGLRTAVNIVSGGALEWGTRWNGEFAQRTDRFNEGFFYMPGHFIRGDLSAFDATDQRGPAEILLSGMAVNAAAAMERPSKANYSNGLADYAGLNLRVGVDAALYASSVVGGQNAGSWPLTGRSKYYLRPSGVSGIHEAIFKSFPGSMTIYNYPFEFYNYGLSYLSSQPEESRINGTVSVPAPCDINMDFENLMLDCLGELEEAQLASSAPKNLKYWDALIQPLSLFFAPTASSTCGNQARKLCMGLTTQCANVDQTLSGVLGFLPTGELGAPADQIEGVPSRLAVPNRVELAGPGSETYYFNPVAMPYYNDYSQSGDSMTDRGWINFAGNLDVAFFSDLQVHFQTSASTNSTVANIYMMGGWKEGGTKTFFNSDPDGFDTLNTGYPTAVTYANYRNPANDTYRVHALRTWLSVIDFDYPLEWSTATKSFKSPAELTEDLLVVQVQHQTDYLSAENAEISFGAQYDGVPQINLANMAFNAVDEATGMASAFTGAIGDEIHVAIESGLSAMDDTLADLPEKLFDPIFTEVIDPVIDNFYTDLYTAYINAPDANYFGGVVTQYIHGVGDPGFQNIDYILKNLADSANMSVNLLSQIDGNLDRALGLIDAFASVVTVTNGVVLPADVPGLLSKSGGKYATMADLGVGILSVLAETLYDSISGTIQEELDKALESATPSLESITAVLLELRDVIASVQTQLDAAGTIANEIADTLNSPMLQDPINEISDQIMAWFAELPDTGSTFDEYTPEEVKAMIRLQITDAFYGSVPCADVQQVLRSQLYEVESAIQEAIDSALQQLNLAMKDLVSEYLAGIDEEINGALGDLSDILGAGQIDGYAHIRHDSLNELRVDGKFQWKVPDEMEFNAYLIIKDLNSTMAGGCSVDGDSLPEVTLGTTDIGLGMFGSDIRADIATKFAFSETGGSLTLIGMGGSFDMTEGEIGFESFAIDDFYAAVAFGAMENYLSANIHCTFTSYEVEGGIFLGKACSLDPFAWDPDVQSVLGEPPFTGIYVYGEGWMPIVDFGCLFRVKAGVGAGIFAFVDGPVGGKIFLGADGEALCVVNVAGEVTLIGLKDGDDMRMKGKGKISGRVGSCPFCVKFKKTVTITYDNGSWDADY